MQLEAKALIEIGRNPSISQRHFAASSGISLGKANYVIRALLNKGYIKLCNFSESEEKRKYTYLLTPKGIKQKAKISGEFLKAKMREYDRLQQEIMELKKEVEDQEE
ncbi:MAG: MarR family EPS-associated transcriptional regulator [Nitrospirae bacterium]|nr:MAG: MarR family EPS-associated transcriptional regulator [Nitrospirota bacterium]